MFMIVEEIRVVFFKFKVLLCFRFLCRLILRFNMVGNGGFYYLFVCRFYGEIDVGGFLYIRFFFYFFIIVG